GDNLFEKTDLTEYASFVVDEIRPGDRTIIFGNGIEVSVGEARGADKEAIFEAQIRYTIEEHFRKQHYLRPSGLKVLSIFIIDRVDNFVNDGIIHSLFAKAFNELKQKYPEWKNLGPEEVEASYFAFT